MLALGSRLLFVSKENAKASSLVSFSFPQVNTDVVIMMFTPPKFEKASREKAFFLHENLKTDSIAYKKIFTQVFPSSSTD